MRAGARARAWPRGKGDPDGAEFGTREGRGKKEEEGMSGGSPHVTGACGEAVAARAPFSNQLSRGGASRACATAPPPPRVTRAALRAPGLTRRSQGHVRGAAAAILRLGRAQAVRVRARGAGPGRGAGGGGVGKRNLARSRGPCGSGSAAGWRRSAGCAG